LELLAKFCEAFKKLQNKMINIHEGCGWHLKKIWRALFGANFFSNPFIFLMCYSLEPGLLSTTNFGARFQNLAPKKSQSARFTAEKSRHARFAAVLPWNLRIAIYKTSAKTPKTMGKVLSR